MVPPNHVKVFLSQISTDIKTHWHPMLTRILPLNIMIINCDKTSRKCVNYFDKRPKKIMLKTFIVYEI